MKGSYKNIFIFAYYSYRDPVFQSAVLPYFQNLHIGTNLRFILLTFEQARYKINDRNEISKIEQELEQDCIIWYQTNWHSGKFKFIKKIFDFIWGLILSSFLILRFNAKAIYSEGFPGAVIAHYLAAFFRIPHLVHTFEPHTNYMVEAGVWQESSWEAILLKKAELKVARKASYIFTATEAMIEKLKSLGIKATIHRIPSCVDTNVFNYFKLERISIRAKYNIKENECVITYLGKFGGMYMDEEIFDLIKVFEEDTSIKFKYFILTPDKHSDVYNLIIKKNLNKDRFIVKTLPRDRISSYLSGSDFGLVPVRQKPSKRFCSPIKDGEYWACGLPIIIPSGISDDYLFVKQYNIGIVMEDASEKSYKMILSGIKTWFNIERKEEVAERCRKFVIDDRSIDKYKLIYKDIFLKL